jgi:hypothetical protein
VVFEAVLGIDPYDRSSMKYLSNIASKVKQLEQRKKETAR